MQRFWRPLYSFRRIRGRECCVHISSFFLPDISPPRVRADYSSSRDTNSIWNRENWTIALHQGKASKVPEYPVREHNKTSQATNKLLRLKVSSRLKRRKYLKKKKKKLNKRQVGVLKNVTRYGKGKARKDCNKENNRRAEEEQIDKKTRRR